jgi:hypothetical protein
VTQKLDRDNADVFNWVYRLQNQDCLAGRNIRVEAKLQDVALRDRGLVITKLVQREYTNENAHGT